MEKTLADGLQIHMMSVDQLEAYADQLVAKKEALDELLYDVDAYINTLKQQEVEA